MVIRKPANPGFNPAGQEQQQNTDTLPYPITPILPTGHSKNSVPKAPSLQRPTQFRSDQSSNASSQLHYDNHDMAILGEEWRDSDIDRGDATAIPRSSESTLSIEQIQRQPDIPPTLQVGNAEVTPRTSSESQRSWDNYPTTTPEHSGKDAIKQLSPQPTSSTNPYHRARSSERPPKNIARSNEESSVDVWAEVAPPRPSVPAPTLPLGQHTQVVSEQISNLAIPDQPSNRVESDFSPWTSRITPMNEHDDLISLGNTEQRPLNSLVQNSFQQQTNNDNSQDEWWNEGQHDLRSSQPAFSNTLNSNTGLATEADLPLNSKFSDTFVLPPLSIHPKDGPAPELPPRRAPEQESPRPEQPPRPTIIVPTNTRTVPPRPDAETPQTRAKRERGETYQIRQITWYDASSPSNPRRSPIMVQNANGPCPLLALVNALTLSTPANVHTELIETLRGREQVTLGLLLDAVFDELMSGRRGDAAQALPDVGELYAFLVTLHTGMNVNPRFVPRESRAPNIMDASMVDLPSTVRQNRQPGGFEETKEMKLYGTFAIPLIHGWLPARTHPAFAALERSAKTYEDAQNLMFREEELEDKLQQQGLNPEEQLMLENIASIKYFLSFSATQLTAYGLEVVSETLAPGSIAILFRNDHFSTLYKYPRSGQLMTLVTDMGYAGHDEVVWESLVDVSGEGCEFYSGDFRPVGNVLSNSQEQTSGVVERAGQGWTTVTRQGRNGGARSSEAAQTLDDRETRGRGKLLTPHSDENFEHPISPNTEQEDHDLALAMQLQEEEEDRERREAAARRREDELSQAYLSSQEAPSRTGGSNRRQEARPLVPPRGGSAVSRGSTTSHANTVKRDPEAGEDAPPPSYEQASKTLPYHPPVSLPAPINASPLISGGTPSARPQGVRPRQVSAYSEHAAFTGGSPSTHRRSSAARGSGPIRGGGLEPGSIRRRSGAVSPGGMDSDDDGKKDCVVM